MREVRKFTIKYTKHIAEEKQQQITNLERTDVAPWCTGYRYCTT